MRAQLSRTVSGDSLTDELGSSEEGERKRETAPSKQEFQTVYAKPKAQVFASVYDEKKQAAVVKALARRTHDRQKMKLIMNQINNQIGGESR